MINEIGAFLVQPLILQCLKLVAGTNIRRHGRVSFAGEAVTITRLHSYFTRCVDLSSSRQCIIQILSELL